MTPLEDATPVICATPIVCPTSVVCLTPFLCLNLVDITTQSHIPTLVTLLLAVIKCIYLPPTYLHFIQDIEDRFLLQTSYTSFVYLPFQEHQMTEKHHMNQNPNISSLCPKLGVVSNNMTQGDDVAKSPGPIDARWG
jgi:hypothetical protein